MPQTSDAIAWYDANAPQLSHSYETLPAGDVHAWLTDLLPQSPAIAFDIGAGIGRDAAWLASRGFEVIAVEPSGAMRAEGARLHGDSNIRWIDDRLPSLTATLRLGIAADFVLLSAVWMHINPPERARAFRKLVSLLKPGAILAVTLRNGPCDLERRMFPSPSEEIEQLARDHGLAVLRVGRAKDQLGREGVTWTHVALRLPKDSTEALPLLRHIILHDDKSSTYKLGLLRALCRAADGAAGLSDEADEEHVALPLGLIALNWLRLYLPLLEADLPQSPSNEQGGERLSFVKKSTRDLMAGVVSRLDLRVGHRFDLETGKTVHAALSAVANTIANMPATHITYSDGKPILPVQRNTPSAPKPPSFVLDAKYLASFGIMRIPRDLWRALQRFTVWVEPALIEEWKRLMRDYAMKPGRRLPLEEARMVAAMTWADPTRDCSGPREIAKQLLVSGHEVRCVWSNRRLDPSTLDIDHCPPWAAWPCGDLWNLLPAHRRVNQREKREKLPSNGALRHARDAIVAWWTSAYCIDRDSALAIRFQQEARASLPGLSGASGILDVDDVFDAMELQRMRLRQDQQVPEWDGHKAG